MFSTSALIQVHEQLFTVPQFAAGYCFVTVRTVTVVFSKCVPVALGVPGGECSQRMWLHRGALQKPAAAPAGLWAVSLQRAGLPLQPVWAAGARQRQGDRQLCAQSLRGLLPPVQ